MIIFQAIDLEDVSLVAEIKPSKGEVKEFCGKYKGLENTACRTESWPLFFDEFFEPQGLTRFCSFTENNYFKFWCFDTVLRGQILREKMERSGVDAVAEYCMGLSENIRDHCFATIASGWVQNEPGYAADSVLLCKKAGEMGYGKTCFDELLYYSKYGFVEESEPWQKYCSILPDPHKTKCFTKDVPESFPSLVQ